MKIGIVKEKRPGEGRVALAPVHIAQLKKLGFDILVETGAGMSAGFTDEEYVSHNASIVASRRDVLKQADIIPIQSHGAVIPDIAKKDMEHLRPGQTIIGMLNPYAPHHIFKDYLDGRITAISMEMIPRITRAQSMDALSSMANLVGYKAALIAANALPKMFPLMMTAAGTIVASRVFVIGCGVAGLQAIATARRLGAVISAYDIRPAVKEQVESLGARFVEIGIDTSSTESSGGYAQQMDDTFYAKQRELMNDVIHHSEVVITTAAIPGKPSPRLVTKEMVENMRPGTVLVDIAAERGGNCELTQAGKMIEHNGVSIIGPVNLPATMAHDASLLYSKNISALLQVLKKDDGLHFDMNDEIINAVTITHNGEVPNLATKSKLEL